MSEEVKSGLRPERVPADSVPNDTDLEDVADGDEED